MFSLHNIVSQDKIYTNYERNMSKIGIDALYTETFRHTDVNSKICRHVK